MTALAQAFQELLAALNRTETPFVVVGSVASAAHGLARLTNDIDLVVDLAPGAVATFCEALGPGFYADADVLRRAIEAGRPFNVIHLASAYKFDLFPAGNDAFARAELSRRSFTAGGASGLENVGFPVASAEDTILAKLAWYRKGGEVSERQWSDILGIVRVQADGLDRSYLKMWAEKLGVLDLLNRALRVSP